MVSVSTIVISDIINTTQLELGEQSPPFGGLDTERPRWGVGYSRKVGPGEDLSTRDARASLFSAGLPSPDDSLAYWDLRHREPRVCLTLSR